VASFPAVTARILIAAAALAGALYLVGAVALGTPPGATDSGAQVVAWLRAHDSDVRLYVWTITFGALAFAVAMGIIRSLLPNPHGYVFLLGAAAFIVETSVQAWIWGGLALHPKTLEPGTARTALDIAVFWGPVLTGATMTMIGAVTVLGFGARPLIPRWLKLIGAIAFAEQAVETITVFGTDGFKEPGGAMNVELGAGITAIWLGALVVWAVMRLRATQTS